MVLANRLQVVQEVIQIHVGLLVDALPNQESQFVGVLTGCRHTDNPLQTEK